MRSRIALLLLLLAAAAPAPAAAAPMAFHAELAIVFSAGSLGEISAQASGVTDVDPDDLTFLLPAALFALQGALPGPADGPVAEVRVDGSNREGSPLPRTLGSGGVVCSPFGCVPAGVFVPAAMPLTGTLGLRIRDGGPTLSLPLSIIGASGFPATTVSSAGSRATLVGGVWTTRVLTAPLSFGSTSTVSTATIVLPDVVVVEDQRNAWGVGQIQRVTPVRIALNGDNGADLWGYGRLTVDFVPEPGALGLLATGLVGLAVLARPTRPR